MARDSGAGLDNKPAAIGFDKRRRRIEHPVDPQVRGENLVLYFVPAEQDTVIWIRGDRIGWRGGEIAYISANAIVVADDGRVRCPGNGQHKRARDPQCG